MLEIGQKYSEKVKITIKSSIVLYLRSCIEGPRLPRNVGLVENSEQEN